MEYLQPSIHLFGILINEPVTVATDLLVSAVCLYAYVQLGKIRIHTRLKTYLMWYFLLMALATAIGGLVGHGFLWLFSATWENPQWLTDVIERIGFLEVREPAYAWKLPGWIVSMLSVMFVERAAIEHVRPLVKPVVGKSFRIINMVELIVFMTITLVTLNFRYVEIHSGYGLMFVVLSLQAYAYYRTKSEGSLYFLYGVGIAAVAALFYMNKIGIHHWFNHFDISHTLMAFSAYVFYLGSVKILKTRHVRY